MNFHPSLFLSALLLLFVPISGMAQTSEMEQKIQNIAGLEPEEAKTFFMRLQKAVRLGDRVQVSEVMCQPMNVSSAGKPNRKLHTSREFLAQYDELMTSQVRSAIDKQQWSDLFVNGQGLMIGRGEVWIGGRVVKGSEQVRICLAAINA